MTTTYDGGIVNSQADAVLKTAAVTLADGAGDLAQYSATTGAAGTVNLVLSKHGAQLTVHALAAALKYLDAGYTAPARAAVTSAGTVNDGAQFRGPQAQEVLAWKSDDNSGQIVVTPASGKVRCSFSTSVPLGLVATGAAGSGVLAFSDPTVAAELATALQAAADRTPYENRIAG